MTLAEQLSAFLTEEFGRPIAVTRTTESSAGARRQNVLFDAQDGDEQRGFCATITPNAAILLKDTRVEVDTLRLAEEAGVPVPHVYAVSVDPRFVGGPLFVTGRVEGETVPRRVLRLVGRAGVGEKLVRQLGEAFAALHAWPVERAPEGLPRRSRSACAGSSATRPPSPPTPW